MTVPDPYGIAGAWPPAPWNGVWPPDPSWDVLSPPILPDPELPPTGPQAIPDPNGPLIQPTPDVPGYPGLQIGHPLDPSAPPLVPASGASGPLPGAPDAGTLAAAPPPADWSGLTGHPGDPPDAADITIEPNTPEVVGPTDAVSGGLQPPPDRIDLVAPPPTDAQQQAAYLADPVKLATDQVQATADADRHALDRRLAAQAAEDKAAFKAEGMRREAVAKTRAQTDSINAEADRLANEKVDPDGWRNSRNLFQTIAMYAAGIVGGLVQGRVGGPNVGLEMINKAIDDHVAAQKANLAHRREMLGVRRESVGEQAARNEKDFIDEQAFRQAALQRTVASIETQRQSYDPRGTLNRKMASTQAAVLAQGAAQQQAVADHLHKRNLEDGEHQLRLDQFEETKREHDLAASNAAAGRAQAARFHDDDEKYRADQAKYRAGQDVFANAKDIAGLVGNGQKPEALRVGMEREFDTDQRVVGGSALFGVKGTDGKPVADAEGRLLNADGQVYKAPKGDVGEVTRKKLYAAQQVISMLDEVEDIRRSVGGESGAFNSDERQRLMALQSQLSVLQKSGGPEGMSSDADMERLTGAVGASDIASFRAMSAGLHEGRVQVAAQVNGWFGTHSYTGKPFVFEDQTKTAKPKNTPDEDRLAKLVRSETGAKGQSIPNAAIAIAPLLAGPARLVESLVRSEDTHLGDGPEKAQLDAWAADVAGPDPERAAAAGAFLKQIADRSRSPALRAYAKRIGGGD